MNPPPVREPDRLAAADLGRVVAWVSPRARAGFTRLLPVPTAQPGEVPAGTEALVACGGGALIDEAKVAAKDRDPPLRLIAVPSLWGSGAECSPVVVLNRAGKKVIRVHDRYLPDERAYWPGFAATVPTDLARHACGDVWAHALEGFLSPLAADPVRGELAAVIRELLTVPLPPPVDPRWWDLSGRACFLQSRAGVGLVHGIAHTVEGPLRSTDASWGHARLCAAFVKPVFDLFRATSPVCDQKLRAHGLDPAAVSGALAELGGGADLAAATPVVRAYWPQILRDPCSRMNGFVVRPGHLDPLLGGAA